jgi:hypothetical protein
VAAELGDKGGMAVGEWVVGVDCWVGGVCGGVVVLCASGGGDGGQETEGILVSGHVYYIGNGTR